LGLPFLSVVRNLYWEDAYHPCSFSSIHLQPFYRKMLGYQKGDFPVTEGVAARTLALPFYGNLREKEIDYVVECLKEGVRKGKS